MSKSGGKSSRKQSILPTWDKKSGPSTAVQPAAYKKDGSSEPFGVFGMQLRVQINKVERNLL